MDEKINPPNKSSDDFVHSLIAATVGAAPGVGSFLSQLFVNVIAPPYEKRTREWMEAVANRIQEIESKKEAFNVNELKENEQFLDAVYATTRTAISTSSKEKKEKLLNALQNIALNISSDTTANSIFLGFIDRFTEVHISICGVLESPNTHRAPCGEYDVKEKPRQLIARILPDITNELINVVIKDLYDNGLIKINKEKLDEYPLFMQEDESFLTSFGTQFVLFIKKPSL